MTRRTLIAALLSTPVAGVLQTAPVLPVEPEEFWIGYFDSDTTSIIFRSLVKESGVLMFTGEQVVSSLRKQEDGSWKYWCPEHKRDFTVHRHVRGFFDDEPHGGPESP